MVDTSAYIRFAAILHQTTRIMSTRVLAACACRWSVSLRSTTAGERGRIRKSFHFYADKSPANDSQETPLAPKRQEDAPSYWNRASPDRALFGSAARYPFMALEPPREEPVQPQRPPLPASMSLRSMVHSEWDDEEDSYSSDQDERPAMGHAGDPLSLGYVTLEEAKILYNLFVKNFNIAMPILDPVVHTHGKLPHKRS